MSLYDLQQSIKISLDEYSFESLIMAAVRASDKIDKLKLTTAFPDLVNEYDKRKTAPWNKLASDYKKSHLPAQPIPLGTEGFITDKDITRVRKNGVFLRVAYEVRKPLIGNLDVVATFDKQVPLQER